MNFIDDEHRAIVAELNAAIVSSGVKMEGNLIYRDGQKLDIDDSIDETAATKRHQLHLVATKKNSVVEIGVNGGHSASIMLMSNPELTYTGIDILRHKYTERCVDILKERFPNRVDFIPGDSAVVFPLAFERLSHADLIHIDGGHSPYHFHADLHNSLSMPLAPGVERHILIDDTDSPYQPFIWLAIQRLVAEGRMEIETLDGLLEPHGRHVLVRPLYH